MRATAAFRMLVYDRSSTAGSVAGVVAIVFLVGQQLTVMFGLFQYMSVLVDHAGADIWIGAAGTDAADGAGDIPLSYLDRVAGDPDVAWAEPLLLTGGSVRRDDGKSAPVLLVGLATPRLRGGPWRWREGSLDVLYDYDGAAVDVGDFKVLGPKKVGDIVEVNGVRARIAGLTRGIQGFGGNLVFTNREKALEVSRGARERTSYVLVKVKPGADARVVRERLSRILPFAEVVSAADLTRRSRAKYILNTGMGTSFALTTTMSALVGIVIITLTMYTNVLTRQRDYAVLRALGARKRDVLSIVFYQALMIAAAGIVIGLTLLALFLRGTRDALPSYVYWWFVPLHVALTTGLCLAGAAVAMRKAVSVDPASVFR